MALPLRSLPTRGTLALIRSLRLHLSCQLVLIEQLDEPPMSHLSSRHVLATKEDQDQRSALGFLTPVENFRRHCPMRPILHLLRAEDFQRNVRVGASITGRTMCGVLFRPLRTLVAIEAVRRPPQDALRGITTPITTEW